jgi:hypothetical protein
VVPAKNEEVLRILDLVCEQEADGLEALLAAVHVITQEEVIWLWREATIFKETEQVIVLTMNIPTNLDGGLKLKKNGLADENFTGLGAKILDLVLRQVDLLAGAAPTNYYLERRG